MVAVITEPRHGGPRPARPTVARVVRHHRPGSRRVIVVTVVIGYLAQVALRLVLVRHLNAPAAHGDEDGYLLAARVLAGGPGGHSTQNTGFARYGYPLLISPAYWFGADPFGVLRRVQVINALLNSLTLPLAYLLGRRLLNIRPVWALGLAMVAATLPAVAFYGEFALADVVVAPIGLGWLLGLHEWARATSAGRRWVAALAAGGCVGIGFTVHVRFVVVVIAHLVVVVWLALRRISPVGPAAASIVATLLVGALNGVLVRLVATRMVLDGNDATGSTWRTLTSLDGLGRALVDAGGQLWYLMISTWGLAALGLLVACGRLIGGRWRADAATPVLAAALLATVGVALASAAALPTDGRATYHVYPRYLAFLAPFWLLVGGAAVLRQASQARATARRNLGYALILAAFGSALMGGLALLVLVRFRAELGHEWFLAFDAPEASWLSGRWTRLGLLRASAAAAALLVGAVLLLRSRRGTTLGVVGLLLVNVVALAAVTRRISEPMVIGQYAHSPTLAELGVRPGDRVYVSTRLTWWVAYNDAREVSWAPLEYFDSELGNPPSDATVAIVPSDSRTSFDWPGNRWGWYRIGGSATNHWSAWRPVQQ